MLTRRPFRRRSIAALGAAVIGLGVGPAVAAATNSFAPLSKISIPGAEIVAATADGNLIATSDADNGQLHVVDLSDPDAPTLRASYDMPGEPTSVAFTADGLLVAPVIVQKIEEGAPPAPQAGVLAKVDVDSGNISTVEIGNQPDSVAIAELGDDGTWAVIAIENEPIVVDDDGNVTDDEDPGTPGDTSPAGLVQLVNLETDQVIDVPLDLSGTDLLFPDDPQPEFVDVDGGTAVVSLQENNGYAVIDLAAAAAGRGGVEIFSSGTARNRAADLTEDDNIAFTEVYPRDLIAAAEEAKAAAEADGDADAAAEAAAELAYLGGRMPDGLAVHEGRIYFADEGEQSGTGGRGGYSVRNLSTGRLLHEERGHLEKALARRGQYQDGRSGNKGIEVEGAEIGTFDGNDFLFSLAERSGAVAVYRLDGAKKPRFVQILPTGVAPEGAVAIGSRDLLVVASEGDGTLSIFRGTNRRFVGTGAQPLVLSGTPWSGAISGLSAVGNRRMVAVPDNAQSPSQIYDIRLKGRVARLTEQDVTKDGEAVTYDLEGIARDTSVRRPEGWRVHQRRYSLARRAATKARRGSAAHKRARARMAAELKWLRANPRPGYWLAQEGNAAYGEAGYRPNLLIRTTTRGRVVEEIPLPIGIDNPGAGVMQRFGFEGVAVSADGRYVLAPIQRPFTDDAPVGGVNHTRIARYDLVEGTWDFFLYPLDALSDGETIPGLSEITALRDGSYLVIERDGEVGAAAELKRVYRFSLDGVEATDGSVIAEGTAPGDVAGKVIEKTLFEDALEATRPYEKLEGLAVQPNGRVWIANDGDGGNHEPQLQLLTRQRGLKPARTAGVPMTPKPAPGFQLTLLHNNDGESDLLPGDGGGVARFVTLVNGLKAAATENDGDAEIMVSAGDTFLAGKEFNASQARDDGGIYDADAVNAIGYDALALGNHDFDFGVETTARFIGAVDAETAGDPVTGAPPFLSANVDVSPDPGLSALADAGRIAASTVVEVRGQRIGVIGATTENLPFISSPDPAVVSAVVPAVQAEVDALTADGVNKIILVSHLQGIDEDKAVAAQLTGIDVYVAGGGDDVLANGDDVLLDGDEAEGSYPQAVTDAEGASRLVVSADGGYRYVGKLVIRFDDAGEIIGIDPDSGPVANFPEGDDRAVEPDAAVQEGVVAPISAFVENLANTVVATASVTLDGERDSVRGKESNLGNLIADATLAKAREVSDVDDALIVGVANGGGIRIFGTLTGPVSEADTFDILPFDNRLTVIEEVTPERLKQMMENALSRITAPGAPEGDGTGRFAQIAGMVVEADLTGAPYEVAEDGSVANPGARVTSITLDDGTPIVASGAPVAGAPNVAVATADFLSRGGDQYPFADPAAAPDALPRTVFPEPLQAVLSEYLQGLGTIDAGTNGGAYADGVNQRILFP